MRYALGVGLGPHTVFAKFKGVTFFVPNCVLPFIPAQYLEKPKPTPTPLPDIIDPDLWDDYDL